MTMSVTQVRLPEGLNNKLDDLVNHGFYSTRSDAVRDAVRRLVLDKMIGIIPSSNDSVKEVKTIRKNLSKEIKSVDDLERLNKLV